MPSQIVETLAKVQRTITNPNVDARQAMALVKQISSDAAQEDGFARAAERSYGDVVSAHAFDPALELRASVATNSRHLAGSPLTPR